MFVKAKMIRCGAFLFHFIYCSWSRYIFLKVLWSCPILSGLLSFKYWAFLKTDGGKVAASVSSILEMEATVTKDLMIIFRAGSLVKVKISAKIEIIELVPYMKLRRIFINLAPLCFLVGLYLFKYVSIWIEFSKSPCRFNWKRIPQIMLIKVYLKEKGW